MNFAEESSFRKSTNRMGAGNPNSSFSPEIRRVLTSFSVNNEVENSDSKCLKMLTVPFTEAHGLPQMPNRT